MKVFISYKFTGEVLEDLQRDVGAISSAIKDKGNQVFCSLEHEEMYQTDKYSLKQIMEHALKELDSSDLIFVFNNSDNRSEGMLIEMGYAWAKGKPIVLAARKGISINSSKGIASEVLEFESIGELLTKINELDFHKFVDK